MKRIRSNEHAFENLIFPAVRRVKRDSISLKAMLLDDKGAEVSVGKCIACVTTPCIKTHVGNRVIEICPVKAISIHPKTRRIEVSEECISCGLCSLVCPVGAIQWKANTPVFVNADVDSSHTLKVDGQTQQNWLLDLQLEPDASTESIKLTSEKITKNLKAQKALSIYPLVATYLRIIGLQATSSNIGDTSSRADVMIATDSGTVPMEVKSATEVEFINLKAIQQALENKLSTARQDQAESLSNLSSLALAFSYPSDRTKIDQLIDDIHGAFGIRIGIVSLPRLIQTAIEVTCGKRVFDPAEITQLKGMF